MFWHRSTTGRVEVAFTDRLGGFSEAPFDALNLGWSTGDDRATVGRNQAALADAMGVETLSVMAQVHGTDVVEVDEPRPDFQDSVPTADALVTGRAGTALLVRVADCVPILLADESAGLVAAVHAGRVGLTSGVVPAAVTTLHARGATTIRAWVGPRACGSCYELPTEMADAVEAAVPGTRSTTSWGTPAVDVGAGVVGQLRDAGVEVEDLGHDVCTIEDERFFSHRRQGRASGRIGGVVVLR